MPARSPPPRRNSTALPANLATDARAVRLRSELDLAHALKDAPRLAELQQRVQADDSDWAARDQLGVRLLLEGDATAGLEQFLLILQKARDWNDGQAQEAPARRVRHAGRRRTGRPLPARMASLLF